MSSLSKVGMPWGRKTQDDQGRKRPDTPDEDNPWNPFSSLSLWLHWCGKEGEDYHGTTCPGPSKTHQGRYALENRWCHPFPSFFFSFFFFYLLLTPHSHPFFFFFQCSSCCMTWRRQAHWQKRRSWSFQKPSCSCSERRRCPRTPSPLSPISSMCPSKCSRRRTTWTSARTLCLPKSPGCPPKRKQVCDGFFLLFVFVCILGVDHELTHPFSMKNRRNQLAQSELCRCAPVSRVKEIIWGCVR